MLHTDVTQLGWLYTYHILHFTGISRVISQYTPRNTKHSLCTFRISFKFHVLFKKSFDFSRKCRPWHKMRKTRCKMQITSIDTFRFSHFMNIFCIFRDKCIASNYSLIAKSMKCARSAKNKSV